MITILALPSFATILGCFLSAGELTSSTIVVAISLAASENCHKQRNHKTDDSQPRKHDVEESKGEIGGGYQPQIITPLLAFLSCHKNAFYLLSQYLVHDSCRTIPFTDAATYAQILIHYCITSPVDADGILGTHLYANTTCHAAVVLALSLVFCHRFLLIG